jgi:twinkle protein
MYETGVPRGSLTGWPALDKHYTVMPGQWTVITGVPGSGKSEFLDALMVNLMRTGEWEFAVYSPENYPVSAHLIKLVEKHLGKPFNPGLTPRMTVQEFRAASIELCKLMMWLQPALKTPTELIEAGLYYGTGKKLGIVLDPWNTLEHQRGSMSETDYISFTLTEVTKLARAFNAHIWLVVHPTKIPRNKDGTRPVVTPYDISGSAHWFNKADNIITVHRDVAVDTQDVDIYVQKIRSKFVGCPGLVTLKYDRATGRYFEAGQGQVIIDPFTKKPERYALPQG